MGQTLSTRAVDKAVTPTVLIMQRLHQDDPTGNLLAKKGEIPIKHICLPGEINTKGHEELVQPPELKAEYKDGLLDPVRLDRTVLRGLMAKLGQYGYAGQIGQNPVPPGGGMFKVEFIENQLLDAMPPEVSVAMILRYWDNAATKDAGAYTAGVKMARLRNGKFVVMDVRRGQWSPDVRETIKRLTAEADGPNCRIANEQEPGSGGKESVQATVKNLAGHSVQADRPTGDKIYRADTFSVQVGWGNVMMLRGDWNHDFIEEMRFFPFGTYKDQVDAAAGAFKMLTSKREARAVA
jgi:predicted phage terminase large subunit-like protein